MRRRDVKTIIAYYYGIPAQRQLLDRERDELEAEYNGLRGTSMNGVPHSSTPGKPTEELTERVDVWNVWGKMEAVSVRARVLEVDREKVQDCLDAIKGEYKRLICSRYRDKYSWSKIAAAVGVQERTVYRWHDKALDRLGEALEETPMVEELLGRASRARLEVSGAFCMAKRKNCRPGVAGLFRAVGGQIWRQGIRAVFRKSKKTICA